MSTATTGTDAVPHFESAQQTDGSHRASKRPRNAINKRTRHKYEENRTVKAKVRISHTAKTELDKHKTETGKNEQDVASVAITTYLHLVAFERDSSRLLFVKIDVRDDESVRFQVFTSETVALFLKYFE